MVVNLGRKRRWRADETGHRWQVGSYRRDLKAAKTYRVFFNGKDVTTGTFYVDTRRGVLRMYLQDHNGKFYRDQYRNEPMWAEYRGHVKLHRKTVAA